MTRLKNDDVWREKSMTREKCQKNTVVTRDASIKQHEAATRRQKYDSCPALVLLTKVVKRTLPVIQVLEPVLWFLG